MIFLEESGVYIITRCKKCGTEIKTHKNYCKKYGDEYYFNPPLKCSGCGSSERIAYKGQNMIIKCLACNNNISKEADTCIHCGHPMQTSIKCPNCKSDNVKKISGANKVGSTVLFGVFAMDKLTKTYECKKCGYKW